MKNLIFAFLLLCLPGWGATYYVSQTGGASDSHGCSTTDSGATNKLTILGGYGCLANGDTLLIHTGTYGPFTLSSGGISGAPKTIKAFPGETVIIRDGSTQNSPITGNGINTVWLYLGANWLVIDGLTIKRGENALLVYGNNNIIQNCIVTEGWESGILVYNTTATNNLVRNNIVYNNNQDNWPRGFATANGISWGSALNVAAGASNNIVEDNYVYWNHGEGLNIWAGGVNSTGNTVRRNVCSDNWAINLYVDGQTNAVIDSNIIWNTNAAKNWSVGGIDNDSLGLGLANETGRPMNNIKMTNNIVINCRDGINAYTQTAGVAYTNFIVENNTLIRNGNGLKINNNVSVTGMTVRNNLILQGTGGLIISLWSNLSGNTFKNNLYYGSAGNAWQYPTAMNYASWLTATGETGSVYSDPLLVSQTSIPAQLWTDPSTDPVLPLITRLVLSANYAPLTSSPAKDAGLTSANVTLDFNAYARPQGSAYDIGALEFISAVPPPLSTISISYPNGGENIKVGTPIVVTWSTNDNVGSNVIIELSRDGGVTYLETVVASVAASAQTYTWTPTAPRSTLAKLRITNLFDAATDQSNSDFNIRGHYVK